MTIDHDTPTNHTLRFRVISTETLPDGVTVDHVLLEAHDISHLVAGWTVREVRKAAGSFLRGIERVIDEHCPPRCVSQPTPPIPPLPPGPSVYGGAR